MLSPPSGALSVWTSTPAEDSAATGANGNKFDGQASRCGSSSDNFWEVANVDRRAVLGLRRIDDMTLAGLATEVDCAELTTAWRYSEIYLRDP